MANITFKNGEMAKKAVAKFNGAPIDGGRSRLKLNLIIDPTQQPARSLSDRIKAVPQKNLRQGNAPPPRKGPNRKAVLAKKPKPQRAKPEKKSLEDLDKEMADYFEEKK